MWAREYLPGYTGHVPLKNDLFGKTAGTINQEICASGGKEDNMGRIALKQSMQGAVDLPTCAKMNKDVFGNTSKFSVNWIAGPTHQVRRQQVPGYTGHVRGMVNRDSMSKSYARVTAALFSKRHPISVDSTPKGRFTSTQRDEYRASNNRRFGKFSYFLASVATSAFELIFHMAVSQFLEGHAPFPIFQGHLANPASESDYMCS